MTGLLNAIERHTRARDAGSRRRSFEGTPSATDEPTSLSSAEPRDDISPSKKVTDAVVRREGPLLRAPVPSNPAIASERKASRVRPDPPIQTASVSSPRTAERLPSLESTDRAALAARPRPPVPLWSRVLRLQFRPRFLARKRAEPQCRECPHQRQPFRRC